MVIGTTSMAEELEQLALTASFNVMIDMPLIYTADEVMAVLTSWVWRRETGAVIGSGSGDGEGKDGGGGKDGGKGGGGKALDSEEDQAEAARLVAEKVPEAEAIARSVMEPVGIKSLLMVRVCVCVCVCNWSGSSHFL